ncbi:MAG: ATP-binding cassette domain-containing protein [Pseudomonadota bacterium]
MLDAQDITLGYNGKPVINLDKLQLASGEQCLFTGASGGGKTTLLYGIAGLMPVISGKIFINGTETTALSEKERDSFRGRNIGIIFQNLHLMPSLSVIDNLMLASYAAGLPQNKSNAESLLERLDISEIRDAMPGTLSQGQAQRVAIARAVLHTPPLIIADEPTSSLDDKNADSVIGLLKQVAREYNSALLIVTHDSRIKAHFKRVVCFERDDA